MKCHFGVSMFNLSNMGDDKKGLIMVQGSGLMAIMVNVSGFRV